MKKAYIALLSAALPMTAMAQSAIDAYQVSQSDFKGSARFMSMGGAFTALGGDLSTLNQNPAGIGIYRSSEIGVTLDINMQSTESPVMNQFIDNKWSQTKAYCNNFGYVGATRLDGALRTFNWGVTVNRAVSFDRVYRGYVPQTNTSLSNYIADFTYGVNASEMGSDNWDKYNPYLDSNIDWLSILAYNSYMINPIGTLPQGGNTYTGLFNNNTAGDAMYSVREQGKVDEYNISFGGNVEDVVYWGLSIGITDLDYKRWAFYSESMANATVPNDDNASGYSNGNFGFDLDNYKTIYGSGWNIKAGVIVKPVNEFRIGLAVHTPTFYKLTQRYNGQVTYTFTPTNSAGTATGATVTNSNGEPEYTDDAYFQWQLNAPWKLMVGVAGVIGNKAIVSADYEFAGYNSMNIKNPYYYDDFGTGYDYASNDVVNEDIKTYFKAQNTIRLGAELRVTPQFSVRGGYSIKMSNVDKRTYDGYDQVYTVGTDPSYTLDNTTQYITCGLGYKYQGWYIDAAYVYKNRESKYQAYTNWDGGTAPSAKILDHNSSIVLSTGFKF